MFSLNEKHKITWVIFSWIRFPLKTNNLKITTKQNKYLLSPLVLWGTFFKLLLKETNQTTKNSPTSAFLVLFSSAFLIQATPPLRSSAKKVSQESLSQLYLPMEDVEIFLLWASLILASTFPISWQNSITAQLSWSNWYKPRGESGSVRHWLLSAAFSRWALHLLKTMELPTLITNAKCGRNPHRIIRLTLNSGTRKTKKVIRILKGWKI